MKRLTKAEIQHENDMLCDKVRELQDLVSTLKAELRKPFALDACPAKIKLLKDSLKAETHAKQVAVNELRAISSTESRNLCCIADQADEIDRLKGVAGKLAECVRGLVGGW